MSRLLIVGVPRSGTTWVGRALGCTDGAVYVNEPDGDHDPYAFRARVEHGFAAVLAPGDMAPTLDALWGGAFAGGRPARTVRGVLARRLYGRVPLPDRWAVWLGGPVPARLRLVARLAVPLASAPGARHVIVKSVRAALCLEWIAARFTPRVLIVERHPLNVLASWVELGYVSDPREAAVLAPFARERWGVEPPPLGAPRLVHQAFAVAVLAGALRDAAVRHAEWALARHDDLCVEPRVRLRGLAESLGLAWGDRADIFVTGSDREGSGYTTNRVAAAQPDRWRARLDAEQVATVREVLARFPHDLFEPP